MVIVQILLAALARSAGRILNTAVGWATTMIFGRVPEKRQIYVSVMTFGSLVWIAVIVGIAFPSVGTFLLSFVPLPSWVGAPRLRQGASHVDKGRSGTGRRHAERARPPRTRTRITAYGRARASSCPRRFAAEGPRRHLTRNGKSCFGRGCSCVSSRRRRSAGAREMGPPNRKRMGGGILPRGARLGGLRREVFEAR